MGEQAAATLVIVRHGESVWNQQNVFTGWVDVDLSEQGVGEARRAGECLLEMGFVPDIAYTSVLRRAIRTLWLMLDVADFMWVPVVKSWRLNERHYGGLQGKNKAETAEAFGADQVHIWRRSYGVRPPLLDASSEMNPRGDRRYRKIDVSPDELPLAESLEDTTHRVLPYWESEIAPQLRNGSNVLIAAHGNSLRALVKHLEKVSDADIVDVNIPTGHPKVYELNADLEVLRCHYHGDPT